MTLQVTQLAGFGSGGGEVRIVGSVAGLVSSTTQMTHAMGNIDVGPASGTKKIIIAVTWNDNDPQTVSSLTVGGVSLTEQLAVADPGTEDIGAAIWSGDIASINGSQAISVILSGNVRSVGVSGVAVSGLLSITADNSDGDDSTLNLTITNLAAPAGGVAIACGASSAHNTSATWGALTERADLQTGGSDSDDHRHTAAWDLGLRTAVNETLDFGSGAQTAAAGAGFR